MLQLANLKIGTTKVRFKNLPRSAPIGIVSGITEKGTVKVRLQKPITTLGYEVVDRDSLGDNTKKPHSVMHKEKQLEEVVKDLNDIEVIEG
jgi:hypothetical protein